MSDSNQTPEKNDGRGVANILRVVALAANGFLLARLSYFCCLTFPLDGLSGAFGPMFGFGIPAAAINVLTFVRREPKPHGGWSIPAYVASLGQLWVAFLVWVMKFEDYSDFTPPAESRIFVTVGCVTLVGLIARWPIRLSAVLPSRGSRATTAAAALVVLVAVAWCAAVRVDRVRAQYPVAEQYLQLGGTVRWSDFHVTGVSLRNRPVGDGDLESLRRLPGLRSLDLSDTPITDEGMDHVARCGNLRALYLDRTGVTDAGLEKISGLKNLNNLWLHDTRVTDRGVRHLKGMSRMGYLDLGKTGVTDACLDDLSSMRELFYLHLVDTRVSNEGLRAFSAKQPGSRAYNGTISVP